MSNSSTGDKILKVLEAYDLEQTGPNQYRSHSPLRPGSDSHAFTLKIEPDGEHGAWTDHAAKDGAGESGSLYELAGLLKIPHPAGKTTPVEDTKRAYKGRSDYATAHGIPETVLSDWREIIYPWNKD